MVCIKKKNVVMFISPYKCCDVHFSLHDKISYEILKSSNHFVPLIAVASKCNRQENEIDESNVSKEDMKDEYNETIADVDDGTMSEATVSLSTCLSDPPTGSSSLVTPTSHCTVSINLPLRSTN
jgi:hypothetical protein